MRRLFLAASAVAIVQTVLAAPTPMGFSANIVARDLPPSVCNPRLCDPPELPPVSPIIIDPEIIGCDPRICDPAEDFGIGLDISDPIEKRSPRLLPVEVSNIGLGVIGEDLTARSPESDDAGSNSDKHTGVGSGIVIGSKAKRGTVGGGGGIAPSYWGVGNGKVGEKAKRSGVSIGNQVDQEGGDVVGNGRV